MVFNGKSSSRIIGIDPGTRYTGVGIIDRIDNRLKYVFSETIVTVNQKTIEDRLVTIFTRMSQIISQYNPQTAAVERIFHSINPRSSLLLGHARGVAMLAIKLKEVDVNEYAPNQVKSALVGVGRASKDQVAAMVKILLNIDRGRVLKEDEADALAAAICHANTVDYAALG
ncbi:MAG: crossover junction endodeoxyribonuclease RuvC [SAR324 cluster bacterium]|nr:crossover junction endodeoxyribonuclease RuvC [SAR324 cluster bacterium]